MSNIYSIFEGITIEIIYAIEPGITIRKLMRKTGYSYLTVTNRLGGLKRIRIISTKYIKGKKTFELTTDGEDIKFFFDKVNGILNRINKELKNEYAVILNKIL